MNKPIETTECAALHGGAWNMPKWSLLDLPPLDDVAVDIEESKRIQDTVVETLGDFGIAVEPRRVAWGPAFTRYEFLPGRGARIESIKSLEPDIARATCSDRLSILAPIPGRNTIGIEIPNSRCRKVFLREVLGSEAWRKSTPEIPLALGLDVEGQAVVGDLGAMSHLLIAGNAHSGMNACIDTMLASILYRFTPDQLRLILIDPNRVELTVYRNLPHLLMPVATELESALYALRWVIEEIERRYKEFRAAGAPGITAFNAQTAPDASPTQQMHRVVVVIGDLAELMENAPKETERLIGRITIKGHLAGIHLIVGTQTPRADIVTGCIKANIPGRIAFQLCSRLDSRVIIEEGGAERLLGQGDMIFLRAHDAIITRAQGATLTDAEIRRVIEHWQHMDNITQTNSQG